MNETLFTLKETLSPRRAWLKKHRLTVAERTDEPNPAKRFLCATDEIARTFTFPGLGATDDEAITDWARKNGVLLWNEEGAA